MAEPTGNKSVIDGKTLDEVEVILTDGRYNHVRELYYIDTNANKFSLQNVYHDGELNRESLFYSFDDSSDVLLVSGDKYFRVEPTGRTTVHEGVEYKEYKKRAVCFFDDETGGIAINEYADADAEKLWIESDLEFLYYTKVSPLDAEFQPIETYEGEYKVYGNHLDLYPKTDKYFVHYSNMTTSAHGSVLATKTGGVRNIGGKVWSELEINLTLTDGDRGDHRGEKLYAPLDTRAIAFYSSLIDEDGLECEGTVINYVGSGKALVVDDMNYQTKGDFDLIVTTGEATEGDQGKTIRVIPMTWNKFALRGNKVTYSYQSLINFAPGILKSGNTTWEVNCYAIDRLESQIYFMRLNTPGTTSYSMVQTFEDEGRRTINGVEYVLTYVMNAYESEGGWGTPVYVKAGVDYNLQNDTVYIDNNGELVEIQARHIFSYLNADNSVPVYVYDHDAGGNPLEAYFVIAATGRTVDVDGDDGSFIIQEVEVKKTDNVNFGPQVGEKLWFENTYFGTSYSTSPNYDESGDEIADKYTILGAGLH